MTLDRRPHHRLRRRCRERKEAEGWFDVSTLKEPYRVEGKKTLGYEIAEQLGWTLPDVDHLSDRRRHRLSACGRRSTRCSSWAGSSEKRPRMISVQAAGCAPIVRAFESGERFAEEFENATTDGVGAAGSESDRRFSDSRCDSRIGRNGRSR